MSRLISRASMLNSSQLTFPGLFWRLEGNSDDRVQDVPATGSSGAPLSAADWSNPRAWDGPIQNPRSDEECEPGWDQEGLQASGKGMVSISTRHWPVIAV